ncbi:hypothetical protein HK099_003830 [Clydaea vesicula]|uniref:G-protein coupled receptors family 3 profile domain-containing protein n=1 Tax=Clydaea vesicula TaxID=447962 RepID=A0AAD5Y0N6_9FUNG|nr:hypothetical protein HK099_003830 [Clydaea vesicula]
MANKSVKNGGGGIYATTNSKLTLKNVEMFNMTSRYGSAITCLYNSDLHCDDCRLHSSTASNYGGFVMGWLSSTLNFTNSKFIGATADTSGGCFSSVWETTVIITNSKLSNCKSSLTVGSGGAMSSDTTSKFHIDNVLISNSSSYSGGAMYNLGHSVIKNSTFNDNFATGSGGAIYDAGFSVYTDIIIANNTAQVGGGIYTQHDSSVPVRTVTFEGTLVVTGNRADLKGGGFAFESQTIVNLSTSEMKISNNIAHSNIGSSILFGQKKAQLLEGDIIYTGPNNSSIDILKFSTDDDYGQVWFEDLTFASKIKKSGVLDVLNIKAFSPPYSVKLKDVSFNNTKVGEMGNITKIEVFAIDALGNTILNINASRPIVVKVFLSNTSNLKLFGESLKGIINNDTKTAVFDNLVISGLTTASTTEEIVIAPVVLKRSDDIIDHPKLRFIIPFCDPDTSAHYNVTTDALGSVSTVCLPKKSVTQPVKIAFFIVSLVLIFCGTVFGIYAFHNRRMSIYRIASPSFTSLITFGCILQFFSVAISIQTGDTQCILIQWVEVLGFMTVALSIILKTYRLKKILINNSGEINARKKSLSDYHLLKWFTLFIFLTIVFLILWTTLDTPYINLRLMDADESWLQEDHCKGDLNIFPSLVATSFILIYLIASVLAFIIRDIPSHFNESKELAMISYQYIILSAIFFPLSTFLQISENFSYICNAVRVLLPTSVTLAFLHVPRIHSLDVEKATASLKELSRVC